MASMASQIAAVFAQRYSPTPSSERAPDDMMDIRDMNLGSMKSMSVLVRRQSLVQILAFLGVSLMLSACGGASSPPTTISAAAPSIVT